MKLTHKSRVITIKSTCEFRTDLKKKRTASKNIVGPTVRRLRMSERTAITQEDLAGRLAALEIQIDRSALARIESGQRLVKDIEVAGLAAALRVPIERLFSKA